jgi:pimeloyl-ACP methyl ester carboxylesterase
LAHRAFVHHADGEELSCTAYAPARNERPERVVIMHGAGTGSKQRSLPLAQDFAKAGFHSLAFDFSGHGQSTGRLELLSLERRFLQARSVVEEFAPDGPVALVGFSMSGQTIADLVEHLGERVTTIVLGAPAAYGAEAWKVPFGSGFTELIRAPHSWRESPVFDTYARYTGRAVLIVPDQDSVIPPGVTFRIEAALRKRATFDRLMFPGSQHTLGLWLAEHPDDRRRVVELCTP